MDIYGLFEHVAARGIYFWTYFENGPWRVPLRGRTEGNGYGNTMRIFWNLKGAETISDHKSKEPTPRGEECVVTLYGLGSGHIHRDDQ